MNLTQDDIKNLLIIISKVTITGAEAMAVASLQQKLNGMLSTTAPVAETKED